MQPKPYPYQLEGVEFLRSTQRALLADQTGLGKSVQALLALQEGPALIICPKVLFGEWSYHLQMWLPDWKLWSVRDTDRPGWDMFFLGDNRRTIGIINYAIVNRFKAPLLKAGFKTVIVDEAHYVKNRQAARAKAVRLIARRSERVFLLTATPPLEKPEEMWHLLCILQPKVYTSYWKWFGRHVKFWVNPKTGGKVPSGVRDMEAYSKEIEPHMLRRERAGLLDLPPLLWKKEPVILTETEMRIYNSVKEGRLRDTAGEVIDVPNVLALITILRKLATGSRLVSGGAEGDLCKIYLLLVKASSLKTQYIVFTHFRETKRLVMEALRENDVSVTDVDDLETWKAGGAQALVDTCYKGGVGLNLQQASDLFYLEPPNGYPTWIQSQGRIRRPDSYKGTQFIWRMYAKDTVDEYLWKHLHRLGIRATETALAIEVLKDLRRQQHEEQTEERET